MIHGVRSDQVPGLPDAFPAIRLTNERSHEPLTKPAPAAKKVATPVSSAFATIGKLREVPLGALLGLTVAGGIKFTRPDLSPDGWMEAPFALFCAGCGILLERTVHYTIGWFVDARLRHLAAWYEARVEMRKLRRYEKEGVLNQVDARRIAARIAKRDIAGGPGPKGKTRGPYKKKPSAPAAAAPSDSNSARPESPPA